MDVEVVIPPFGHVKLASTVYYTVYGGASDEMRVLLNIPESDTIESHVSLTSGGPQVLNTAVNTLRDSISGARCLLLPCCLERCHWEPNTVKQMKRTQLKCEGLICPVYCDRSEMKAVKTLYHCRSGLTCVFAHTYRNTHHHRQQQQSLSTPSVVSVYSFLRVPINRNQVDWNHVAQ